MDSFASLRQTIQNRINAVEEALGTKLNETKSFDDSFQMVTFFFKYSSCKNLVGTKLQNPRHSTQTNQNWNSDIVGQSNSATKIRRTQYSGMRFLFFSFKVMNRLKYEILTQALFLEEIANPMDCTLDFDLYSQSKAETSRLDLLKFDILTEPHAGPQSSTDLMTGQFMDDTVSEYLRPLLD